mmetsp:Transcript_134982/g.431228  ORF Transcript_134982/g.431228 Transcript_134982/m.431228 type:complete len:210 (-) Transcript_134982:1757-2386(-)
MYLGAPTIFFPSRPTSFLLSVSCMRTTFRCARTRSSWFCASRSSACTSKLGFSVTRRLATASVLRSTLDLSGLLSSPAFRMAATFRNLASSCTRKSGTGVSAGCSSDCPSGHRCSTRWPCETNSSAMTSLWSFLHSSSRPRKAVGPVCLARHASSIKMCWASSLFKCLRMPKALSLPTAVCLYQMPLIRELLFRVRTSKCCEHPRTSSR